MFEQVFGWVSTTLLPGLLNAFNASRSWADHYQHRHGGYERSKHMIGNAIQAVLPVIESIIMVILSVSLSTVKPNLCGDCTDHLQNIWNVITSIQGVFEGLIQFITGVFTGNWSGAWEGVKSIFGNAFSALVGWYQKFPSMR